MPDEQPRNDLERRALAAFTAVEPPADFVDRVLDAADLADPNRSAEPSLRPRLLALGAPRLVGLLVAAVAAVAVASVALGTGYFARPAAVLEAPAPRDDAPIGTSLPDGPPIPALAIPADLDARVDAYIDGFGRSYGEAFKFHGVVAIVHDGEVRLTRGYGRADLTRDLPNTATTRFKIGSLTQTFTAVAVLQLRDRGLIDLDAPISKYIPDYPAIGARVTVRHLLTHTSGIPSYTDAAVFSVGHTRPVSVADVRAIFQDLPLEFAPGTDFDLSNSGYFLLGQIVENVSRQPFSDYLTQNVFAPAGMRHSAIGGPVDAIGHEFDEDEVLVPAAQRHASAYGAAAGMVSTAADLARWDRALRSPGLILSQKSLDEMTVAGKGDYGIGWFLRREEGGPIAWHPGGVEGYNATVARFLRDGVTVFVLANTEAVDTRGVAYDLAQIVHGGDASAPKEHVEQPLSLAQYARYAGTYVLSETTHKELKGLIDEADLGALERVSVHRKGERLFMHVPDHSTKWMHFAGDDTFFFKDPSATTAEFGPPGAPVTRMTIQQGELRFILRRAGI